jgi:REP element-mobilizing transposase RayT
MWGRPSLFVVCQDAMLFYRRHLPHWIPDDAVVFVTWRLAGSTPPVTPAVLTLENTGRAPFYVRDEALGRWRSGPLWLQDPRVASMLVKALQYGEAVRAFYQLHAWVVMPNHVHVLFEPRVEMPRIMRWLKGATARRANRILGRTGQPFWQDESYDHWVRSDQEFRDLICYIEENPVKAGLVDAAEQWLWSSAGVLADDATRSSAPQLPVHD